MKVPAFTSPTPESAETFRHLKMLWELRQMVQRNCRERELDPNKVGLPECRREIRRLVGKARSARIVSGKLGGGKSYSSLTWLRDFLR